MASVRRSSISYSTSSASSSSQLSLSEKQLSDQKTIQHTVKYVYQAHIAGNWRNVSIFWSKNTMVYSLYISVESEQRDRICACKVELKPLHFWARKGCKNFMVDGNLLEFYWDLRSAKFSGPEPIKEFYIALVSHEEAVLLLGDLKKKAYKKTKAQRPLMDALLFYKEENLLGRKSFSTRASFDQNREHDIVVESSTTGDKDPEMWISIDGIVLIHIRNLQWKFRGNQTVQVNKQAVQVLWDVYAWLFLPPGSDHGTFIFKGGDTESDVDDEGSQCSGKSKYYSTRSFSKDAETCVFLYAWKVE